MVLSQIKSVSLPGPINIDCRFVCGICCSFRDGYIRCFSGRHHLRHLTSTSGQNGHIGGIRMQDYLKEKELTSFVTKDPFPGGEECHNRLLHKLATYSKKSRLEWDILERRFGRQFASKQYSIHYISKYPKGSFFPDGHINVALARFSIYNDFIRDARDFRSEEISYTRRLYPLRAIPMSLKNNIDFLQFQRDLESNLMGIVNVCNTFDLTGILRQMYLLGLPIRANVFGEISKKLLRGMSSLNTDVMIETIVFMMSYMDEDIESVNILVNAVGSELRKRVLSITSLPVPSILRLLHPIVLVQAVSPSDSWLFMTDERLLNRMISEYSSLDINNSGELFTFLTVSNSIKPLPESIRVVMGIIGNNLLNGVDSLHSRTMQRLLMVSKSFESQFLELARSLYRTGLGRSSSIRPTVLATTFLRLRNEEDHASNFFRKVGRRYGEITPKVLVDLYCQFLEEGPRNFYQLRCFEMALSKNARSLSMQDLSNILIYHSSHGRYISQLNDMIKSRFVELKSRGLAKNEEILDIALSMSLVGLHTQLDVWDGVDLPHLVYSTPTNILVYLAYALLITGEYNIGVWSILLERMIYEPKTYSHELYEVLMVANVYGLLPDRMRPHLHNRITWILQHTKSQHYAKMVRQRYETPAPIGEALDKLGLKYERNIVINELYEAPFYIESHKLILDPLRDSFLHATTNLDVGEVRLRHNVWSKQGYRSTPLNRHTLAKCYDDDTGVWNISELVEVLSKHMKFPKPVLSVGAESNDRDKGRSPLVHTGRRRYLETKTTHDRSVSQNVRKLQQLLLEKSSS
ncbi:hypothetical protein BBOV_I004770 [Babesia bovis T2Bo]|uniref:hypothetical protein n=1 Tax=Babesia bovis T2Bo TaxID=484906 RepID=UPI001C35B795|nr:hypothetical protein BBOV_I004770 [Babesia bovis T2Bo]EDO05558.2 hypothetical protein BBOV_I004770 [Babesia bovis T2Bo]